MKRIHKFLRFSPYIIVIGLSTGYIVKSYGGEIIEQLKYDRLASSVVSEYEEETEPEVTIIEESIEVESTEEESESIEASTEVIEEIEEPQEVITSELLDSGYEFQNINFDELLNRNEDVCGWITLDDTVINYPIMNGTDEENSYYLHHDIDGNKSSTGMLYVDTRCTSLASKEYELSDVTLIYGHHMKNGSMFSSICKYMNQSYYESHPYAVIYTPDGYAYKATMFAGIITSGTSDELIYADNLSDEDKYDEFIETLRESSTFTSDVDVEYGDKLIGFVTCEYTQGSNSRYVLFAKLEKQYTNELQKEIEEESKKLS